MAFWGAHAFCVLVSVFHRNELSAECADFPAKITVMESSRVRDALASMQNACAPRRSPLQQLIRIDVDRSQNVFGQRKFIERFPDKAAQPDDGFTAHQNVKTKLAL